MTVYLINKKIIKQFKNKFYSRINIVKLTKNGHVKKIAGKPFSRGDYNYNPSELLKEKFYLKELNDYNFPKVIDYGKDWVALSYCGEELTSKNMPHNWKEQIKEIVSELDNHNIIHRDIKKGNVLVLNKKIKLIDFGWAVFKNENHYISPRELDPNISKDLIYNNKKALEWFMKSNEK